MIVSRFLPSSQISGRMCNTVASITCMMWKCVAARHYTDIGKQLSFANKRNRVCGAVLVLSQNGACTNLLKKFPREQLKARPIECYHCQPASFLIGQYLLSMIVRKSHLLGSHNFCWNLCSLFFAETSRGKNCNCTHFVINYNLL